MATINSGIRFGGTVYKSGMEEEFLSEQEGSLTAATLDRLSRRADAPVQHVELSDDEYDRLLKAGDAPEKGAPEDEAKEEAPEREVSRHAAALMDENGLTAANIPGEGKILKSDVEAALGE